jgi:hypothetical protein
MLGATCLPLVSLRYAVNFCEVLRGLVQDALIGGATPFASIIGEFSDERPVNQYISERENLPGDCLVALHQFFQREAGIL